MFRLISHPSLALGSTLLAGLLECAALLRAAVRRRRQRPRAAA